MIYTKGMDAAAVQRSAVALRGLLSELETVQTVGRAAIQRVSVAWQGSDSDAFQRDWVTIAAVLTGLRSSMEQMARTIDHNVGAQQATSGSDGPGAASTAAGAGAVGATVAVGLLGNGAGGASAASSDSDESFADALRGEEAQAFDRDLLDMAAQAYEDPPGPVGDFVPMTEQEMYEEFGISPVMHSNNPIDGFDLTIYRNPDGQYVVAFRGSDGPQATDWAQDGMQAAGLATAQYVQAVSVASALHEQLGDDVIFTGHSLGGGLATVSSVATGAPAVTFNSAGVHDHTMQMALAFSGQGTSSADVDAMRDQLASGQIRSYQVVGEPVSLLQGFTPAPDASGTVIHLQPQVPPLAAGGPSQPPLGPHSPMPVTPDLEGPFDPVYLHNPIGVQDAMDQARNLGLLPTEKGEP